MKQRRLSACLIVRDGAADLLRSLPSLAHVVDELVIVDTGSVDETRSVARRFTDQVYDFVWCDDFAAAKNEALRHATGDWVFFPDADEKLVGSRKALRRALRTAEAKGIEVLSLWRREVDLAERPIDLPLNPAVRLFRRLPGLRYRDPIHEVLVCPGRELREADVPARELSLLHWGYAPERRAAKRARNIALLERMEREGRPKQYLHYYLAGLYLDDGCYEAACREVEASLAAGEHPPVAAFDLWRNYYEAAQHVGEAVLRAALARGLQEVPDLPDTYAWLGNLADEAGRREEAHRLFREALAREAVFSSRYPEEFDTFRKVVPQIEQVLREESQAEGNVR